MSGYTMSAEWLDCIVCPTVPLLQLLRSEVLFHAQMRQFVADEVLSRTAMAAYPHPYGCWYAGVLSGLTAVCAACAKGEGIARSAQGDVSAGRVRDMAGPTRQPEI